MDASRLMAAVRPLSMSGDAGACCRFDGLGARVRVTVAGPRYTPSSSSPVKSIVLTRREAPAVRVEAAVGAGVIGTVRVSF